MFYKKNSIYANYGSQIEKWIIWCWNNWWYSS